MSALVTADLHLSANPRDNYRFAAMERLADLISKHKPDTLLLLGDLTEEKNFHSAELVNDIVELIHVLSGLVKQLIFMMGNHDYKDADVPFFHFLRRLQNVEWVGKPSTKVVSDLGECLFLPHTLNYERDWKEVFSNSARRGLAGRGKAWPGEAGRGFNYIFAHQTFEGASTEHGKRLSGIPLSALPRGVPVIAGDIHTPQTLGPVTYVGSPITIDFGEDFNPRVLLLTGDKMKSIPLPGPQKRLLTLEPGYKVKDFTVEAGDVVKIRYLLPEGDRENWPALREKLREQLQELDCVVYAVQPVLEKSKQFGSVVSKRRVNSDVEMVKLFGKQNKASDEVLDAGLALVEKT